MKHDDILFLQGLQKKLNEADNVDSMNDSQANPRFWVIKDAVLVEDEDGKPYIFNHTEATAYTLEEFCQMVNDEVHDFDNARITDRWNAVDKNDAEEVSSFVNNICYKEWDGFDWVTDVIRYREDWKICENTFFLTKEAAERHIKVNHYHYRKPHTYAMTAWRSPEFERFMELFKHADLSNLISD